MKQARIGWAAGTASALLVLSLSACEPKGSTTTAGVATAPAGAKPAVKVTDEPMKPEEIAAAQAGAPGAAAGGAAAAPAPAGSPASAKAILQPAKDTPGFSGRVIFYQAGSQVRVVADVTGVSPPGNHGFHVHENGRGEHGPGEDFPTPRRGVHP